MIGKTVGKYRFLEELGRDGTATLYKAVDETLEREVAIKVLNPDLTDSEVMKRFQAEATTLARLHHPDIARIHEIHRTESDLLLVMELVRGETLDHLATRCGPLAPERAAYLVAQVLGALEHAHAAGVVHRDLKPTNVMVTDQGGVKVLDFGVARVANEDQKTSAGFISGSPAYMAPERLAGKALDGRADVYSAGVIFYRLLTGNVPFDAPTPLEMVQKQLAGSPTLAIAYRPSLPGWCQAILDRALARSPEDRFATADAFRATLLAAISEATEATGAYPIPRTETTPAAVGARAARIASAPTALAAQPSPPTTAAPAPQPARAPLPPTVTDLLPPASSATASALGTTIFAAPVLSPAAGGTTIVLRKKQFALVGGLLLVLVVAVILLAVAALRPAPGTPAGAAPAVTSTSDPAATAPETLVATPSSVTPPPIEIVAPPLVLPPPSSPPVASPNPSATSAATAGPPTATVSAADSRPATPPTETAPTVARPVTTTPFSFDAKAVVADGDKRRERDAVVRLADGTITVTDKSDKVKAMYVVSLDSVVGLTYSNTRQPLWNTPAGPAEAMRVESGAFGFLKGGGDRNWFGVRTRDSLLVLRVDDDEVAQVTAGLEQGTGLTLERLVERKNP